MKTRTAKLIKSTLIATALLALQGAPPAWAGRGQAVLPPQSSPYGESYGEWAADWWRWVLSIPTETNPLSDTNGAFVAVGQHGPVWFLAGATGTASVTRKVVIPEGKALFFPIINTLWTAGPSDPPITVKEIRDILAGVTADVTGLSCTIDGVAVKHLEKLVTVSPVFSLAVAADNVLGLPAAVYAPNVDEGFYLMLEPLSPGKHTIHWTGNNVGLGYALDITYNVTVQRSHLHGTHDGND